jgi:hypothetical protein
MDDDELCGRRVHEHYSQMTRWTNVAAVHILVS